MENLIKDRYNHLVDDIKETVLKIGDPQREVTVVAVSKTQKIATISTAINAGIQTFGENRVQELVEKSREINKKVNWHFIGHLQKNKIKHVVPLVDLIHSVDSISLAEQLLKEAEKQERKIEVLLQFNVSGEESKFGFDPKNIENICEKISGLPKIRVNGLMTIAPFTSNTKILTECFSNLRKLFQKISTWQLKNFNLKYLSMGMSNDYKIAIAEGSNMLRIGTAIFGPRI